MSFIILQTSTIIKNSKAVNYLHPLLPFHLANLAIAAIFKHVLTRTNYDSYNAFETVLEKNKTVAFLVIQNDSIKYEWYSKKNSVETMFTSFSMAKSYISALIGVAIEEGHIKSVA